MTEEEYRPVERQSFSSWYSVSVEISRSVFHRSSTAVKRESVDEEDTKRPFPSVWLSEHVVNVMGDVNASVSEERDVPAST